MDTRNFLFGLLIHIVSIPIFGLLLMNFETESNQNVLVTMWIIGSLFGFSFMPAIYGYIIQTFQN